MGALVGVGVGDREGFLVGVSSGEFQAVGDLEGPEVGKSEGLEEGLVVEELEAEMLHSLRAV
jgi:hypothetical protein